MSIRQYIGARYVPYFDGEWNENKNYEALTCVMYNSSSYTSKKMVPSGVVPTNTEYWALTGTMNGQIININDRLGVLEENTNNIISNEYYNGRNILIIGDSLSDENLSMSAPNWVTYFKNKVAAAGGNVVNYSYSGRALSPVRTDNLISNLVNIPSGNFTDIVLFMGVNDWASNADKALFINAVKEFGAWKVSTHPNAVVHLITPPKCVDTFNVNTPLSWYRTMLCKLGAAYYGWNIIDAFNAAPNYNGNVPSMSTSTTVDGLHFKPSYASAFCDFVFYNMNSGGTGMVNVSYTDDKIFYVMDNQYYIASYYNEDGSATIYINMAGYVPMEESIQIGVLPEYLRPTFITTKDIYAVSVNGVHNVQMVLQPTGELYLVFKDLTVSYAFADFLMSYDTDVKTRVYYT